MQALQGLQVRGSAGNWLWKCFLFALLRMQYLDRAVYHYKMAPISFRQSVISLHDFFLSDELRPSVAFFLLLLGQLLENHRLF